MLSWVNYFGMPEFSSTLTSGGVAVSAPWLSLPLLAGKPQRVTTTQLTATLRTLTTSVVVPPSISAFLGIKTFASDPRGISIARQCDAIISDSADVYGGVIRSYAYTVQDNAMAVYHTPKLLRPTRETVAAPYAYPPLGNYGFEIPANTVLAAPDLEATVFVANGPLLLQGAFAPSQVWIGPAVPYYPTVRTSIPVDNASATTIDRAFAGNVRLIRQSSYRVTSLEYLIPEEWHRSGGTEDLIDAGIGTEVLACLAPDVHPSRAYFSGPGSYIHGVITACGASLLRARAGMSSQTYYQVRLTIASAL